MPPPRTQKEVRSFMGRLNYIARFISQMTAKYDLIFKMLQKHNSDRWDEECQIAFDKVKEYLTNALVLVPPVPRRQWDVFCGNMMKSGVKSKPFTTRARNSQTMSQSTHHWKKCIVHWHGQLKGSDSTCSTTLLGSLQGWIQLSTSSIHPL